MTTIHEVVEKAGVSTTTASNMINDTPFVSKETRAKVITAMEDLGYRSNNLAKSTRQGETCIIGLILPDSANPLVAEIAHSIEDVAFRQGYDVIRCNTEVDLENERSCINPPLATIAQPKKEIYALLVKILFKHITNKSHPDRRFSLPGKLVIRSSCGGVSCRNRS